MRMVVDCCLQILTIIVDTKQGCSPAWLRYDSDDEVEIKIQNWNSLPQCIVGVVKNKFWADGIEAEEGGTALPVVS